MRYRRGVHWMLVLLFAAGALGAVDRRRDQLPLPHEEPPGEPIEPDQAAHGAASCSSGRAAGYTCRAVDLLAVVPAVAMGGDSTTTLNDLWGWTDPQTGREYALVGLSNGTAFVDVTDGAEPRFVGHLPTRTFPAIWRSVKVYRDHAYVVADRSGTHGMQVFDLTRLRGAAAGTRFTPDAQYFGRGRSLTSGETLASAHNVAIDEETGFAYVVGSATCRGGLHMVDIREPERPRFAGCFAEDGYTHDVQCVVYRGPDAEHRGREICMAANEDTLTVVDVSDKKRPRMLSRTSYEGVGYTHQGWFTEDHARFLLDDEFDEMRRGHGSRTYVWDTSNLDAPRVIGVHTGSSAAIDHNQYVRGRLVYQANYTSGLRILDLEHVAEAHLHEVAFFDIVPQDDRTEFDGAWNVYPYFASGNVLISGIGQGLFVVRPEVEP